MMNNFVSEFSSSCVSGVAHIGLLVRRLPPSRLHIRIGILPIAEPLLERIGRVGLSQTRTVHDASGFVVDERYAHDAPRIVAAQVEVDTLFAQAIAQGMFGCRRSQGFIDKSAQSLASIVPLDPLAAAFHVALQFIESDRLSEHGVF